MTSDQNKSSIVFYLKDAYIIKRQSLTGVI
jgi:hypothetical protein